MKSEVDKINSRCPRKPWYRQMQIFMPWNSLYIGIQFGNHFFGIQVRQPDEPY